jgi:hypothetical protein
MSRSRVEELLSKAVAQSSVTAAGRYTKPATWGVYKINPPKTSSTKRYRIGNHPVRHHELSQEFGAASTIAIFTTRPLAVELAALYNVGAASTT